MYAKRGGLMDLQLEIDSYATLNKWVSKSGQLVFSPFPSAPHVNVREGVDKADTPESRWRCMYGRTIENAPAEARAFSTWD